MLRCFFLVCIASVYLVASTGETLAAIFPGLEQDKSTVNRAKQLVQYGVSAFWNFAATDLNLPGNIAVENVHLAESLMRLSYNISNLPE